VLRWWVLLNEGYVVDSCAHFRFTRSIHCQIAVIIFTFDLGWFNCRKINASFDVAYALNNNAGLIIERPVKATANHLPY
jgi:hypothetical protein